jgi:hypothetical protein
MIRKSGLSTAVYLAGLFAPSAANAQSSQNQGYGAGNIDRGLVVGVVAGFASVAGIGITYLFFDNRGVTGKDACGLRWKGLFSPRYWPVRACWRACEVEGP